MFDDVYDFDYDRVVEDTDELYDDEDFWGEDIYDEYTNEREYDCYYHNVVDELDNEQPFSYGGCNLVGQVNIYFILIIRLFESAHPSLI